MLLDKPQPVDEKKILTAQYIAIALMFVLFFGTALLLSLFLDGNFVQVIRIAILVSMLPLLFISFSSIKYKTSVYRPKGRRQHSTGKEAVTMGILIFIAYLLNTIIALSPILDIFAGMMGSSPPYQP